MSDDEIAKAETSDPRDPLEWLREHRRGQMLFEMGEEMRRLVAAVAHTQKAGTLTLKISIKPDEQLGIGAVIVSDDVTVKAPKPTKSNSLFYINGDWDLQRHDPGQTNIIDELKGKE